MSDDDLIWRSALELGDLIRKKELTPVEVTDAALARLEAVNPLLNAFCLVAAERAREQAREAEIAVVKGEPLGPLHGVPISIKDVLATRGLATTGGSRLFADAVPEEDAIPVARLKAAGAVILGKTNTSEFGHKAVTENPLFGVTRNPWNPERTPGGSTGGGGAAVAAGVGPLALGSDGGGSVRIPAAFCGVFGLKPSFGRVPHAGGFPGFTHVSHVGPLARTVRDAAALLDVIAGGDDRDRRSLPREPGSYLEACDAGVAGLHVAWTPDLGYAAVDPRVRALCETAAAEFESLGCHVEVVSPGWEDPEAWFGTLIAAQFYAAWSDRLPDAEPLMDPTLVTLIRRGGAVPARDYVLAVDRIEAYWAEVRAFLERFDLLLMPTVAVPPFDAGARPPREVDGRSVSVLGWMPFTFPFNLTGQPAASVPAGFTDDGLPVGLQIVGRRHADATVLAAAAAFEAARPWSDRRPRL
ncbi:MAG: amidase [Candidatus Rokubacteria bacterium]|nr:amidase [Candidatus Rokubacteria bacterium]MBI4255459.1 amidase [Candidatus Rokubacteria bacterium]